MITLKPSLQGRFTLVWSGDSALQPRPVLPDSADDAAKKAWEAATKEWDHALKVAGETGNWEAITKPGDRPTVFAFEIPRLSADFIRDRAFDLATPLGSEMAEFLFRVTCKSVTNFGDATIKFKKGDRGLDYVDDEFMEFFQTLTDASGDYIAAGIMREFRDPIIARLRGPSPKS